MLDRHVSPMSVCTLCGHQTLGSDALCIYFLHRGVVLPAPPACVGCTIEQLTALIDAGRATR